jgi:hypothetical protein
MRSLKKRWHTDDYKIYNWGLAVWEKAYMIIQSRTG